MNVYNVVKWVGPGLVIIMIIYAVLQSNRGTVTNNAVAPAQENSVNRPKFNLN